MEADSKKNKLCNLVNLIQILDELNELLKPHFYTMR